MTAVLPRATVMAHERATRATLSPTRARPLLPATAAPSPPAMRNGYYDDYD